MIFYSVARQSINAFVMLVGHPIYRPNPLELAILDVDAIFTATATREKVFFTLNMKNLLFNVFVLKLS